MDEVDGMSGGDRGGVGAMNALIKKSRVRLSSCGDASTRLMRTYADPDYMYCERPRCAEIEAADGNDVQPPFPSVRESFFCTRNRITNGGLVTGLR